MTRINKIRVFLCFLIVLFCNCRTEKDYSVKAIKIGAYSYGYQIDYNGKLFIRQEFVPAIPCKKHFGSEELALAIGSLVLEKIKKKKMPSVSTNELIEKGIDTKCVVLQ